MTDNFSPADLIYLYLDGEADSAQQTVMFAALASDPDLQQEFSEALSMRRAFEHERASAKPPMYLSTRVMQDAGVLQKAVGASAIGGGLWLWLRKAAMPVGSLVIGSVVTFFAMNWLTSQREAQSALNATTSKNTSTVNSSAVNANNSADQVSSQSGFGSELALRASSVQAQRVSTLNSVREGRSLPSSSASEGRRAAHLPTPSRVAAIDEQLRQSTENAMGEDFDGGNFIAQQVSVLPASAYESTSYSRRLAMVNVPVMPFNAGKTSDFSLQFNRVATASAYGAIPGSTNPGAFNDPSLSIYYNTDENEAFGLGLSNARYNVSDNTKSGISLQNPRVTVWTVEYQRRSAGELLLGAPGYISLALGGSWNTGAVMGLSGVSFGLSFPVSVIRINTGIAGDILWYQSQSGLSTNGKVSAVIGIGYNW